MQEHVRRSIKWFMSSTCLASHRYEDEINDLLIPTAKDTRDLCPQCVIDRQWSERFIYRYEFWIMSAKLNFVPSSRGDKMLLGDHTYYEFRKSVNFVTSWCTFRKCTTTALVTANEPPKQRGIHCHQADPDKLERTKVNEASKRKAVDDLNERRLRALISWTSWVTNAL